jgi:cation:H+ antiporter
MDPVLLGWLALFVVASTAVVGAGVLLARSGDRIAERTGLGGLLIGMVLVAGATSLPEIAVDVAAALGNAPDLAIGDLLGSSMANMALLAIVDLVHRGQVWHRVGSGHARTAAIAIALTAIAVMAILRPFDVHVGWVGIESVVIFVSFVSLVAWTRRSTIAGLIEEQSGPEEPAGPGRPASGRAAGGTLRAIRSDLVVFGLGALVIVVAAPVLVSSAEGIAETTGLGQTAVGATFLALTTSLPELSTVLVAARIGAFDLAVGTVLGSNAFNMAVILLVDVAYLPGPVLAHVAPLQAIAGMGAILLMSLVLAGIIHGSRTRASRLEPSAWMVLITYLLVMAIVWTGTG